MFRKLFPVTCANWQWCLFCRLRCNKRKQLDVCCCILGSLESWVRGFRSDPAGRPFDLLGLDAGAKRNLEEARAAPSEVFFVHLFFFLVWYCWGSPSHKLESREWCWRCTMLNIYFHYLSYLHSLVVEVTHHWNVVISTTSQGQGALPCATGGASGAPWWDLVSGRYFWSPKNWFRSLDCMCRHWFRCFLFSIFNLGLFSCLSFKIDDSNWGGHRSHEAGCCNWTWAFDGWA